MMVYQGYKQWWHVKCINNIRKNNAPNRAWNEVLNIAEELGIVDWSKVALIIRIS